MGQFTDQVVTLTKRAAAPVQAGIIAGQDPTAYNAADPLRLWVIQVGIIIIFTQLLALLLGRIRQPRVIAEVLGGVLLGPSVMGHIPHFTEHIFPSQSIPLLTLTANIGLVFFLFLVGVELDTRSIRHNARAAFTISAVGLVIPLGLGAAIAVPIYHNFVNDSVNKGDFILFVAVAIGITAFPVLCRILTELRLLDTPVGVTALAAGVGNDVVGWILLALAVALVNNASGLQALWVLLAAAGYVTFLLFPGRWAFRWLAKKTGSFENGRPTTFMMAFTFLLVFASAFFTDVIGIHPIFGGFVAGLIIPHEGGFAIAIVEKLEDLISLIFLPLYFVQSGLNTNLGTLDTGKTWAYIVIICTVAFFSKFTGSFFAARTFGFSWRESGAIGTLMSCKGLVELIVLNVGLSAQILDVRTFSMFVLHALVLTFITTPLTLLWYPSKHRTRVSLIDSSEVARGTHLDAGTHSTFEIDYKTNFAVVLNKVEHLPAVMTLTQLLHRPCASSSDAGSSITDGEKPKLQGLAAPQLSALRLIELDERSSAVLRSQKADSLALADPLISVVRSTGRLHRIPVSGELAVVPESEFAHRVGAFVREHASHMVVLPWTISASPVFSVMSPGSSTPAPTATHNPFEAMFGGASPARSVLYSNFIRKVFADSPADVALFVERAATADVPLPAADGHHLFLPFFGGSDDRLALELIVQLCANPAVSATVVRIGGGTVERPDFDRLDTVDQEKIIAHANYITNTEDTVYAPPTTNARLASDTADSLIWARYAQTPAASLPAYVTSALSRIVFRDAPSSIPSSGGINTVLSLLPAGESVIAVVGRARQVKRKAHNVELRELGVSEELSRTVGDVGAAFLSVPSALGRAFASGVLVAQARREGGQVV